MTTTAPTNARPEMKIGDGVCYTCYTDLYPATVIKVSPSGKTITTQNDRAERLDKNGLSEDQHYAYSPNPNGRQRTWRWSAKRRCFVSNGFRIAQDRNGDFFRRQYLDPSF